MSKKSLKKAAANKIADKVATDTSPKIYQRNKIDFELNINARNDFTERQKQFIDLILNKETKIVFVDGPAGTAKTFLSIYCALLLLNKKSISDILYIRSIAESASKSLGSLPGDTNQKLDPFLMPFYDKLDELLPACQINALVKDSRVQGFPINYARGSSWNAKFIIADESQNFDHKELTTLVTRLGMFSKMIVAGDQFQSDINGKSGFMKMFKTFDDQESRDMGIHCFTFTKEDIVRSGVLKFIIEKIEKSRLSS